MKTLIHGQAKADGRDADDTGVPGSLETTHSQANCRGNSRPGEEELGNETSSGRPGEAPPPCRTLQVSASIRYCHGRAARLALSSPSRKSQNERAQQGQKPESANCKAHEQVLSGEICGDRYRHDWCTAETQN